MIRCGSCGTEHPLNTLFCDECGFTLGNTAGGMAPPPEPESAPAPASPPLPENCSLRPLAIKLATRDGATQYERTLHRELIIGRADHGGPAPDIDLSSLQAIEQGVSRRHARIVRSGDDAALEDLSSLNGTFIGGHRLTAGHPEVIRPGDEVQFGKVILVMSH